MSEPSSTSSNATSTSGALGAPLWLWLASLVLVTLFAAVLSDLALPVPADPWLYVTMARQWLAGQLPYQDFFFSHPPLHLLPYLAWQALWPTAALQTPWLVVFCALGSAWGVAQSAHTLAGPRAGVVAAALWLSSLSVLRTATAGTGLHEALWPLSLTLAAVVSGKSRKAGVWAALTVLTSTLVGALAVVLLLADAVQRRLASPESTKWQREPLAVAGVLLLLAGSVLTAVFGLVWLDQVYLSPLQRPAEKTGLVRLTWILWPYVRLQPHVWVLAATALWVGKRPKLLPVTATLVAGLGVLLLFGSVHVYYGVILTMPLAVLAGVAVEHWWVVRQQQQATAAATLLLAAAAFAASVPEQRQLLEFDTVLAAATQEPLQETCHQLDRDLPATATLMGDSNLAPLLALCTNRPLWHGLADTNTKRYRADPTALAQLLDELTRDPPDVVTLLDRHGLAMEPQFVAWVQSHCGLAGELPWTNRDRVILLQCRKPAEPNEIKPAEAP